MGDVPELLSDNLPIPTTLNRTGAKGVGESGCTASIPVLVGAVLDALRPLGIIEKFPHLKAWRDALLASQAVKSSTVANIEAVWQENLIINKRWLAKYVSNDVLGAAAA